MEVSAVKVGRPVVPATVPFLLALTLMHLLGMTS